MNNVLIKILGFVIGAGMLIGLIGLLVWMISIIFSRNPFGGLYLPWMPWFGSGRYTIKGKIKFRGKEYESKKEANNSYPMHSDRVVPHSKPSKPKSQKPDWWRFLTEESIGSLLEKHRKKKA